MSRFLLLCFACALILSGCNNSNPALNPNPTAIPTNVSIYIDDNYFDPPNIKVPVGTRITWQDYGYNSHTVTSGEVAQPKAGGMFDSGTLSYGAQFTVTLNQAGTVKYYCRFHGSMGMTGTITVR